MDLESLVRSKNEVVLRLEQAKKQGTSKEIRELGTEAGVLESRIGQVFQSVNRIEEACVNLVSAASCFRDARRNAEAVRILRHAMQLSESSSLISWIEDYLEKIGDCEEPAAVFRVAEAHIVSNDRLRLPQREAYEAALAHFGSSSEHAIIQLPVGCGKTGVMSILPFGIAMGRVLAIAPNLEIRKNLAKNFDYTNPDSFVRKTGVLANGQGPTCAVLDESANVLDCDASDFVVANIQQLVAQSSEKWLGKLASDFFDVILVDEGHHNVASSWERVFEHFPNAKIASFTATPIRADGKTVVGKRIYAFPISRAIKEGYVRDISTRKLQPTQLVFSYRGSTDQLSLDEVLQMKEHDWFSRGVALAPECNEHIVDASIQSMEELRAGGKEKHQIIAAACSIDHAKVIRSMYQERGCAADVLHSKLSEEEQETVRARLERGDLDVVVQVQMLGEGADYPRLGVAAIFRPYRHLVPYVQFVGRIMRVVKQDAPGDPDNRGYVVSHVGLNVDRWWEELRKLDADDQGFFSAMATSDLTFQTSSSKNGSSGGEETRRRFRAPMQVLQEVVERFVQEGFVAEDSKALVDDVIHALTIRGISMDILGISREELEAKVLGNVREAGCSGEVRSVHVQPQRARQEARKRLDERVKSGAKQLLNELGFSVMGMELVKLFPGHGTNNMASAIILLNRDVQESLGVGGDERGDLSVDELRRVHDDMDALIDRLADRVRGSGE